MIVAGSVDAASTSCGGALGLREVELQPAGRRMTSATTRRSPPTPGGVLDGRASAPDTRVRRGARRRDAPRASLARTLGCLRQRPPRRGSAPRRLSSPSSSSASPASSSPPSSAHDPPPRLRVHGVRRRLPRRARGRRGATAGRPRGPNMSRRASSRATALTLSRGHRLLVVARRPTGRGHLPVPRRANEPGAPRAAVSSDPTATGRRPAGAGRRACATKRRRCGASFAPRFVNALEAASRVPSWASCPRRC